MLANLRALFGGLLDIILLRRGPDSLPGSPMLLAAVVGVYAAVNALAASTLAPIGATGVLGLAMLVAFTFLWYRVTLIRARKPERFVQTMTAMFGVNTLFMLAITPMIPALVAQSKNPEHASAPLALVFFLVFIWCVVINVNIVRTALEWPGLGAFGLFVAQNLAWYIFVVAVFGDQAQPS